MKITLLLAAFMALFSQVSFASNGLSCSLIQGEFPVTAGIVERVSVGQTRINGVIYSGYTAIFLPGSQDGEAYAKIWGPGHNPRNPTDDSAILLCIVK